MADKSRKIGGKQKPKGEIEKEKKKEKNVRVVEN